MIGPQSACYMALCVISGAAFAGEHQDRKDDFDGKVTRAFVISEAEWLENGRVMIQLLRYNASDDTVALLVRPPGVTDCKENRLELKTHEGVIHAIRAQEAQNSLCFARIPTSYVKHSFAVRIPMFRGARLVGKMDTTTLDVTRLTP
jgi:hypothetical protein